eukprot:TRINITY_DN98077_c0_g1_i1.p1 TRINITY_DN98077_c0_g1~~TRINITY_DN98077_c0_g1_i1.p1  ORF type:complete len:214 (-),score=11.31 TRINITY_DN98077_c0_g1_i1:73-690(-)
MFPSFSENNIACLHCGGRPRFHNSEYCSRSCRDLARAAMCLNCRKKPVFQGSQFCSRGCRDSYNPGPVAHATHPTVEQELCIQCGNPAIIGSLGCSSCTDFLMQKLPTPECCLLCSKPTALFSLFCSQCDRQRLLQPVIVQRPSHQFAVQPYPPPTAGFFPVNPNTTSPPLLQQAPYTEQPWNQSEVAGVSRQLVTDQFVANANA